MSGATLSILLASGLVVAAAGCSKGNEGSARGTAKGMIAVDGAARKSTSCLVAGLAADEVLRIRLDDDSLLTIPVQEAAVYYSGSGGDRGDKLTCEESRSDASASEGFFEGSLNRKCSGGSPKIELSLVVRCGTPKRAGQDE
jgi:hypothetical protein